MAYTPAPMPNLLIVGSDYTAIGDGSEYHLPIMCYNYAEKRVEGYYLTVGEGASGTLSVGTAPLGTAYNVYTNVIASLCWIGGEISVSLFNTGTMAPAFSNSAANFAGAIKCAPYATVALSDTFVTSNNETFIVPYTNTHFLVVTPARCWRIRISDGAIQNEFAIGTNSVSYSRLKSFVVTADTMPPPMVTVDGQVVVHVSSAEPTGASPEAVSLLLVFNPITGVTTATNYNAFTGSVLRPGCLIPMPDGRIFTHRSSEIYWWSDSALSARTGPISGSVHPWVYACGASAQDEWWFFLSSSSGNPQFPNIATISGTTATITQKISDGSANALWAYVQLSSISSSLILYRRAATTSTGTSIGSYISVRDKSTGAVATGFTEAQMIDHFSGNAISGTGFNNKTFARINLGNMPDPTLYTLREVLQLMPAASLKTTCKVFDGSQWVETIPKVYDGSQWVEATPKVRDSSGWL